MIQKKTVWFILTVEGNFFEDNYLVQGMAFNLARIGLDVLTMQSVSNEVNYIFGKDPADG